MGREIRGGERLLRNSFAAITAFAVMLTALSAAAQDSIGAKNGLAHPGYAPPPGFYVGNPLGGAPLQVPAGHCPGAPAMSLGGMAIKNGKLVGTYTVTQSTGHPGMCFGHFTYGSRSWFTTYDGTSWSPCEYTEVQPVCIPITE